MPTQISDVVQHLRRAILQHDEAGVTDGQLLGRFIEQSDEAAVAALVRRHGLMVWGVCRRILRTHHDAEDAFQATFLVLVRKAGSVRKREMVGNWLYGVAHQTALKARESAAKTFARERQVVVMPEPTVRESDLSSDLQAVLDQELSRLPDKYRVGIVLCDLEGKTRKEAARQLGLPEGTLAGRLTRGRAMLAKRLIRSGLAVLGGTLATELAQQAATGAVPTSVMTSTIKAATVFAAGQTTAGLISAKVVTLTEGTVKAMFLAKLKSIVAVVVMLGFVATGATIFCRSAAGQEDKKPIAEKTVEPAAKQKKAKNKEIPTAWGKEVGGLQAGLSLRPDEKRPYHHGETVTFIVRVRNVGKETIKFKHIRQFLDENPPAVTNADGKAVEQHGLSMLGIHVPAEVSLEPGKEIQLESRLPLRYELRPASGGGKPATKERPLFVGTGKVSLQYEQVIGNSSSGRMELDPTLSKLATGKLELEVKSDPPAAPEKKAPQKKELGENTAKNFWAGMSVNQPLFRVGQDTSLIQFNFALANESDKVLDPKIPGYPRLIVNGEELDLTRIPGVGPRDGRFKALPPGDNLQFGMGAGQFFDKPGVYRVYWQGEDFRSNEVVFRVVK